MAFGPAPVKDANAGAPITGIKLSASQKAISYQFPGQNYCWREVEIVGVHPGILMARLDGASLPLPGEVTPRGGMAVKATKGTKKAAASAGLDENEPPTNARERKIIAAGMKAAYLGPDGQTLVCPFENLRSMFIEAGKAYPGSGLSRACGAAVMIEPDTIPFLNPETGKPIKFKDVRVVEHPVSSRKDANADPLVLLYKTKSSTGKRILTARTYLPAWKLSFKIGLDLSIFETTESVDGIFRNNIIVHAGTNVGMMAWRPSAPKTPGPFGRFQLVKFAAAK